MLADARRWGELYRVGYWLADELQEKSFTAESAQLITKLEEILPENSDRVAEVKSKLGKSTLSCLPTARTAEG